MKKVIPLLLLLIVSLFTCACINTVAVHKLNEIASKCMEEGDTKCAVSRLESSIDLEPDIYESRYNLAVAYIKENKCEDALKQLEEAKNLDDKQPMLYYTKGIAYNCIADSKIYTKNEDGVEEKIVFMAINDENSAKNEYIKYLKDANDSFEEYMEMAAKDNTDIKEVQYLVEQNNQIIDNYKQEHDLLSAE